MGISAGAGSFSVCARTRIQALSESRWKAASSRRSAFDSASRAMLTRIKPEMGATSLKDETLLSLESRGAGFGPSSRLQECTDGPRIVLLARAFGKGLIKLLEVDDLRSRKEGKCLGIEFDGWQGEVLNLCLEVPIGSPEINGKDSWLVAEKSGTGQFLNRSRHLLVELIDHNKIPSELPDASDEAVQLLVFRCRSLGRGPTGSVELVKDHQPILGNRIIEDRGDLEKHLPDVLNVVVGSLLGCLDVREPSVPHVNPLFEDRDSRGRLPGTEIPGNPSHLAFAEVRCQDVRAVLEDLPLHPAVVPVEDHRGGAREAAGPVGHVERIRNPGL